MDFNIEEYINYKRKYTNAEIFDNIDEFCDDTICNYCKVRPICDLADDFAGDDDLYCTIWEKELIEGGFLPDCEIINHTDNQIINHPQHYTEGGIECIDAMIASQGKQSVMDFCLCNAFKYIWRQNKKGGLEDIKKANWYLEKYLELAHEGEET